jgi:uncharacterized protein
MQRAQRVDRASREASQRFPTSARDAASYVAAPPTMTTAAKRANSSKKKVPAPRVREHEIRIAGLDPRHDGVRISQLSDIHVGSLTPPEHIRAAIDASNAADVDVVVLTGDYVCWRRREALDAEGQLAGLRAKRVLAVLGNHDYMTWGQGVTQALTANGYEVMKNQHTTVELNGAPLQVVGIDDPVTRHHDLEQAWKGVRRDVTTIALSHTPSLGPEISERGAQLILSGHTHGGQIYVPGVTDRIMRKIGLHYRSGRYDLPVDSTLYVTPGVGFSGVTHRVGDGTDAEVAVFTLRAA